MCQRFALPIQRFTDHVQPFANILVFLLNASMLLLCGLSSFKNLRKDQRPFLRLGTNVINDILQWLNDRDDYLCSIPTAFCSLLAFETECLATGGIVIIIIGEKSLIGKVEAVAKILS